MPTSEQREQEWVAKKEAIHQLQKDKIGHKCERLKNLSELRRMKECHIDDPRQNKMMKVRDVGYEQLSFLEAAKKYQKKFYDDAENKSHSFPNECLLKNRTEEILLREFDETESGRERKRIPKQYEAVAKVFNVVKEQFCNTPSFVSWDYDFDTTIYRAMGVTGKNKREKKKARFEWEKEGFKFLPTEQDVCLIALNGNCVLFLVFEVKSLERASNLTALLNKKTGKAEDQLFKGEQINEKIFGAMAFSHTFHCSFIAFPFLSRSDVKDSLGCDCDKHILTEDDLQSCATFRRFLKNNGITLLGQNTQDPSAKACYLDMMQTYVAASASISDLPRTTAELHQRIDGSMNKSLLLLTLHQKEILWKDQKVLFLAGGQGTGKTYLFLKRAEELASNGASVIIVNMSDGKLTSYIKDNVPKSLWIAWRHSDASYQEALHLQKVIDALGEDKVEVLTEIKRCTHYIGEFFVAVTRFIRKRFPCASLLPMEGLNYSLDEMDDMHESNTPVIITAPPEYKWVYLWAPTAAVEIGRYMEDSLPFIVITRTNRERDTLVRELDDTFQEGVAFLDSEGRLRGATSPGYLIFHQEQVTGLAFENLVLLDDETECYHSWSRMVCMARRSLHVITTEPHLSSRWKESQHLGLVCSISFRKRDPPPSRVSLNEPKILNESAYGEVGCSWKLESIGIALPGFVGSSNTDLENELHSTIKQDNENTAETQVHDIHDLLRGHGLDDKIALSPRVIGELLGRMLEECKNEGRRLHIAFDDAPVHQLTMPQETDEWREEWESILRSLISRRQDSTFDNSEGAESNDSEDLLGSLNIAFLPYVQYQTTTFNVKKFQKDLQLPTGTVMLPKILWPQGRMAAPLWQHAFLSFPRFPRFLFLYLLTPAVMFPIVRESAPSTYRQVSKQELLALKFKASQNIHPDIAAILNDLGIGPRRPNSKAKIDSPRSMQRKNKNKKKPRPRGKRGGFWNKLKQSSPESLKRPAMLSAKVQSLPPKIGLLADILRRSPPAHLTSASDWVHDHIVLPYGDNSEVFIAGDLNRAPLEKLLIPAGFRNLVRFPTRMDSCLDQVWTNASGCHFISKKLASIADHSTILICPKPLLQKDHGQKHTRNKPTRKRKLLDSDRLNFELQCTDWSVLLDTEDLDQLCQALIEVFPIR
ncbi:unnamed protein product [Darwinula stevensoni]|uniref:Uncharacterized protein n=1 Tax=Darwinula stevensoni TaxID=69355 RepID=A0A7R9FS02_9CRUS|nr:unnamed protein product [Darwinula stevensoni]CAG0902261.1 unnamed protein product [Darwinula stevensoni]